jgi:ComF family protein
MPHRLRSWSQNVLARLPAALPTSCALCGCEHGEVLCDDCHARHFTLVRQRCRFCAIPLPSGGTEACGACLKRAPAFDTTIVAVDYAPPVDQLVLALKFGNRLELAPLLARMLRHAAADVAPPDCLMPVPLGAQRLAGRGFNQALEIARPLSRAFGVPLAARLAVRQRETQAQSLLHPDERQRNMRKAFVVPADAIDRVRGAHVGVVDDVMTTGETLNELAATLKRFGAARVTNFVFARTAQ